ncbi:MAG: hypothetical protein IJV13_05160 [Prevotella sp.]|nr:hypothetical protein [Prevotella sp.]
MKKAYINPKTETIMIQVNQQMMQASPQTPISGTPVDNAEEAESRFNFNSLWGDSEEEE